jgi:hypothetical protein
MDNIQPVDSVIKQALTKSLLELEVLLAADILTMFGPIIDGSEQVILKLVEDLASDPNKKQKIFIVLTTPGGTAETVERYVNILRHHYKEVNFLIPDQAFSAGTIFCMSGDNIYMDYFSVLGPIDPQVRNKEGRFVGALGYLDKINELIEKARNKNLTQAEFLILKDFDLAELKGYEQAKDLTIDLLKRWLVLYKFKDWNTHQTNPNLRGQPVTAEQKEKRAAEIAKDLSDNNKWKSHGRPINIQRLEGELRLKIENYSDNAPLRSRVIEYHLMLLDYVSKNGNKNFYHTRKFF